MLHEDNGQQTGQEILQFLCKPVSFIVFSRAATEPCPELDE
jgi:hypothetical protein